VRLARADLKRRVAHGDLAVADVILSRPWEADTMEVCDLLLSQRRWGMMRARKALAAIPIPENKHIGSLTGASAQRAGAEARADGFLGALATRGSSEGRSRAPRVAISTMCPSGSRTYNDLNAPRSNTSVESVPRLRR
jgi:hypothetical protein